VAKKHDKDVLKSPSYLFLIGTSDDSYFAYQICALSIQKNTPNAVVRQTSVLPNSFTIASNRATNFSFNRLSIPLEKDFLSYDFVIYMDSDQLLLKNLTNKLQNINILNGFGIVKFSFNYSQSSVIVWQTKVFDLAAYKKNLENLNLTNISVDTAIDILGASKCLPDTMNSLDWISDNTDIVHFTYMPTQPWVNTRAIFYETYKSYCVDLLLLASNEVRTDIFNSYQRGIKKGFINPKFLKEKELKLLNWSTVRSRNLLFLPYWVKNNRIFRKIAPLRLALKIFSIMRIL
jgi:hypothetical protein